MSASRVAGAFLACALLSSLAFAGGDDWRPCGPGPSYGGNRWIKQGGWGADYRPGCRRHDECLANGGSRAECDRQFKEDLLKSCECSNKPLRCKMRVHCMHCAVRLFGGCFQGGCGEKHECESHNGCGHHECCHHDECGHHNGYGRRDDCGEKKKCCLFGGCKERNGCGEEKKCSLFGCCAKKHDPCDYEPSKVWECFCSDGSYGCQDECEDEESDHCCH